MYTKFLNDKQDRIFLGSENNLVTWDTQQAQKKQECNAGNICPTLVRIETEF